MVLRITVGVSILTASLGGLALADDANRADDLLRKAARAAEARKSQEAVRWATEAIETSAADPFAYYLRGRERLRLGDFAGSVEDFDQYVKRDPDRSSRLWERGIACYYAGQFQAGADQFKAYQSFYGNDVENAVWHVVCLTQVKGFDKARAEILPIKSDARVPMMAIYDLFRGRATPDDVLRAARDGDPNQQQLNDRLMYAHLYLGLYHEANGNAEKAQQHMQTATRDHRNDNYMWDVARVHAEARKKGRAIKSKP